jgi:phospholipid/cholesterol/gamma-HCH transport system substrate-binding protein
VDIAVNPGLRRFLLGSKRKLQGVVFLLFVAFLIWLASAFYSKTFITVTPVTLRTSHTGTQLALGADVKLRGIIVGDVRKVSTTGSGAVIKLALQPNKAKLIPSNVLARILPKTLFGQKFVDLVVPPDASPTSLRSGSVIPEDRSKNAIEVETVLSNLFPLLETVAPEKLNATLTAIADSLEGRGNQLGDNLSRLDTYLRTFNQHLPAFTTDISELASVADSYDKAAPDLLRFLANSSVTSQTITSKQGQLLQFLRDTATFADTATGVLTDNQTRLIQLGQVSRPILDELASRSSNISQTIDGLAALAPKLEQVFGTGTNENWLHIQLIPVTPKGAYVAPNDCPKYVNKEGSQYGPNCGTGSAAAGADAGSAAVLPSLPASVQKDLQLNSSAGSATAVSSPADSVVGSPAEQKLIASIVGAVTNAQAKTQLNESGVADMLLGPMMRGTTIKTDAGGGGG